MLGYVLVLGCVTRTRLCLVCNKLLMIVIQIELINSLQKYGTVNSKKLVPV